MQSVLPLQDFFHIIFVISLLCSVYVVTSRGILFEGGLGNENDEEK